MILDQFSKPYGENFGTHTHLEQLSFGDHGNLGLGFLGGNFARFNPFTNPGQELPQPLDFERLVDEFYRRNPIVYSAVRALSRSASEPNFQACTVNDLGVAIPDDPMSDPLAMLLAQPNEEQECYEFMEQLIIHLQVTGNAFIHKIRSRNGNVVHLELFRPDLVSLEPMASRNGRKIARYFIGFDTDRRPVPARDIIHMRLPDAFDEYWGLSPLFILAKYGDIDKQSTDFLRAYFLNRGVPSGMLVAKGRVQDNDRQEMKDSWRMQFSGEKGWHKIPVMDQGVEYQALSTGLKDMDLGPVFNQTETRISMVYGVPPILLGTNAGLERSTFSNFSESRRGFWTETLVPMYTRIVRRLTKKLAQEEFGPRRMIKADVSKVAGLQDNKEKLRALATKGYDKGLFTTNEARDIMGMDPIPEDQVVGNSLKLGTASVLVPREQAHQFADLVGDVVTDVVQEEIVETDEGKIAGVGDPNPAVGEPDDTDPIEQKVRKAEKLEEEAKRLRKEAKRDTSTPEERSSDDVVEVTATIAIWDEFTGDCLEHEKFACPTCIAKVEELGPCAPGQPGYPECKSDDTPVEEFDHIAIIEQALDGDEDALEELLALFPGNFRDDLIAMIDRVAGGAVQLVNGVTLLELSIGEDLRVIMNFFELVKAMEAADKTPDEVRQTLMNAKSRLRGTED